MSAPEARLVNGESQQLKPVAHSNDERFCVHQLRRSSYVYLEVAESEFTVLPAAVQTCRRRRSDS